jgi:two-component system nitrate/nitrite response regulator NarP
VIRVFIADDHPMIQAAVESLLRSGGQEVVGTATSGEEALERLADCDADVVVLDIQMPGGSGLHVARTMRERGDRRPIVLLTAAIGDPALREAVSLDVKGFLLKSSDPVLLIECIDEVCRGGSWVDPRLKERLVAVSAAPGSRRPLTERERELVHLVRQGLKNREIAERMNTTEGTVKAYLNALYDKLGIDNRTELALQASEIIGSNDDR